MLCYINLHPELCSFPCIDGDVRLKACVDLGGINLDALCGCGNVDDLEALVASNAIPRRFAAQGFNDSAALLIATKANNTPATSIIDALCDDMGRALYNLIVTLDLERISIGGSVFWLNAAEIALLERAVVW